MNKLERVIQLSASICSLLAFIVLIYEKTDTIKLSIEYIIMYILFCIYVLFFTSLFIYLIQYFYQTLIKGIKNPFLKFSSILFLAFVVIFFYTITVGFAWTIITSMQF